MNRKRNLLLALCLLLLLLAGYLLVLVFRPDETEETAQTAEEPVLAVTEEEIAAICYRYEGEEITLERTETGWQLANDPDFPLDTTTADTMAGALADATYTRVIDRAELEGSEETFGLDAPAIEITVTDTGGGETRLALGDQNSLTGAYYLERDGEILTVGDRLSVAFSRSRLALARMEEIPSVQAADVQSIEVDHGDGEILRLIHRPEGSPTAYTDRYTWFVEGEDGSLSPVDLTRAEDLLYRAIGLSFSETVAIDADAETLAGYGLGEGAATLTLTYDEAIEEDTESSEAEETEVAEAPEMVTRTFTLAIGNLTEEGVYVRIPGSTQVYRMLLSQLEELMTADAASLTPTEIAWLDVDELTGVDVKLAGTAYSIEIERDEEETVYTVDGAAIDAAAAEEALRALTTLESEGMLDAEDPEDAGMEADPTAVLTLRRDRAGFESMGLEIRPLDDNFYRVTFDGRTHRVSLRTIDGLLEQLEEFGQTPSGGEDA